MLVWSLRRIGSELMCLLLHVCLFMFLPIIVILFPCFQRWLGGQGSARLLRCQTPGQGCLQARDEGTYAGMESTCPQETKVWLCLTGLQHSLVMLYFAWWQSGLIYFFVVQLFEALNFGVKILWCGFCNKNHKCWLPTKDCPLYDVFSPLSLSCQVRALKIVLLL